MSKLRVNCWKPEMVISSQASQKWDEGSETRLNDLTGFYENLSVELQGYESPRVPGNQAMQQVWSGTAGFKFLRSFSTMQGMLEKEVCEISRAESGSDKAISQRLVFKKQRSCFGALQEIQLQGRG
jgi:hypothetical protein